MTRATGSRFGGKKGAIDSAYVLYFRDFYKLYDTHLAADPDKARSKLLKLLTLTVRFLYLDYAAELVDFGRTQKLLSVAEAKMLLKLLCGTRDIAWMIPKFPGKAKLALLVDYVSYILHHDMKLAIPPMSNNLGNRRSTLIRADAPERIRLLYPIRSFSRPSAVSTEIEIDGVGRK